MKRKDIRQKVQQKTQQKDQALLAAFVATFSAETYDIYGQDTLPPFASATEPAQLKPLYAVLPGPFPPLYETLVLSYRWPEVELPEVPVEKGTWPPSPRLLANPPGDGLDELLAQIVQDKGLWDELAPHGYVQFARAWGGNYDPVCFDTRRRRKDGDCPIVQIDHEEILCNYRIKVVSELAGSFRELVQIILSFGGER